MNVRTDAKAERQRTWAIMNARQRRMRQLAPLHADITRAIEQLGWKRARPIVVDVVGHAHGGRRGTWWRKVGKRNGTKLLTRLRAEPVQRVLFDRQTIEHIASTANQRGPPHTATHTSERATRPFAPQKGTGLFNDRNHAQRIRRSRTVHRGRNVTRARRPRSVSRAIVHDILTAPTIDEVFQRRELTHARDILDERLTILGVRWMQGDYDTAGAGFYAVIEAANDDGEKLQISCGARNVMAQLWRLAELGAFPITVAIVESGRATAAGYKPMTLEPRTTK
jgi:hypothetical protein